MAFTQKILVPTDFSPAAVLAVDAASLLARQFDAEVVLLYVYDPSLLSPLYAVPGASALLDLDPAPRGAQFEERVVAELGALRDAHLGGVRRVEVAVAHHASAADGICAHAKKVDADLVVLSTHGRTGLAHMLIGSVAEKVVRHAPCPVLTLRSKA